MPYPVNIVYKPSGSYTWDLIGIRSTNRVKLTNACPWGIEWSDGQMGGYSEEFYKGLPWPYPPLLISVPDDEWIRRIIREEIDKAFARLAGSLRKAN